MSKKRFLSVLGACVLGGALFMSRAEGPAAMGAGDRTGSPVAAGTCNDCHSGGGVSTPPVLIVSKNGNPVSTYTPGETYDLLLTDNEASPPVLDYGFQMVALMPDNSQAGSFVAQPMGSGHQVITLSGRQYIEHRSPLFAVLHRTWQWTAPATAGPTDTVSFYGYVNFVNSNLATSGDLPVQIPTVKLAPGLVGTQDLQAPGMEPELFPNPAVEYVQVRTEGTGAHTLRLYDMSGREWLQQTLLSDTERIDLRALPSGHYYVHLLDGQKSLKTAVLLKR